MASAKRKVLCSEIGERGGAVARRPVTCCLRLQYRAIRIHRPSLDENDSVPAVCILARPGISTTKIRSDMAVTRRQRVFGQNCPSHPHFRTFGQNRSDTSIALPG